MGKIPTFSKSELVIEIAAKTGFAQVNVKEVIDATLAKIIAKTEAGSKVTIMGFGSFEQRQKKARLGRNPATGETVEIPASAHLAFKPAKKKS